MRAETGKLIFYKSRFTRNEPAMPPATTRMRLVPNHASKIDRLQPKTAAPRCSGPAEVKAPGKIRAPKAA